MNEVRSSQIASAILVNSASSKGAKETSSPLSSNSLPEESGQAEKTEKPKAEVVSAPELQTAIVNVNDYVQSLQRDLQFSVDNDLDQTVIKVVDSDSGELIRQIPEDIFLELARRLQNEGDFRLLNALG